MVKLKIKSSFHTRVRLYIPTKLFEGANISLTPDHKHYLFKVMRLKEHSDVYLFNGSDGEWKSIIVKGNFNGLICKKQIRIQSTVTGPILCFSLIKYGRIDWLVEKATELGASFLCPIVTDRTIVKRINSVRLERHIIEAAEQSERLTIPTLCKIKKFSELFNENFLSKKIFIHCDERITKPNLQESIKNYKNSNLAILVGPEGGFSLREKELLSLKENVVSVTLGNRILRSDTAALATLSFLTQIKN